MSDHIVVGQRDGYANPQVIAHNPHQRAGLVDMLLRDPDYPGTAARTHVAVYFHIRHPEMNGDQTIEPRTPWMRIGFYAKFGATLFVDQTVPKGADWCWAALRPNPIADPPPIYYDQDAGTQFPPRSVMHLSELGDVILEWVNTAKRPTSVDWMPINALVWELTEDGGVHVPGSTR